MLYLSCKISIKYKCSSYIKYRNRKQQAKTHIIKVVGVYLIGYVQLSKGVGQRGVVRGGGVTSIALLSSCFLFKKNILTTTATLVC